MPLDTVGGLGAVTAATNLDAPETTAPVSRDLRSPALTTTNPSPIAAARDLGQIIGQVSSGGPPAQSVFSSSALDKTLSR